MTAAAIHVRDVEPNELLTQHAGLVKRSASRLRSRLPASVQTEDLIQAGMIVLLEAAARYDETQGASFETYAAIRVRGAMLDEVRNSEGAPRSVQRKARQLSKAVDAVVDKHHALPIHRVQDDVGNIVSNGDSVALVTSAVDRRFPQTQRRRASLRPTIGW